MPPGWYHRRHEGTERDPDAEQVTVLFVDPNAKVRFGTVEVYVAQEHWTLAKVAEGVGLGFTDIGKRKHGRPTTLKFCDELARLYGQDHDPEQHYRR